MKKAERAAYSAHFFFGRRESFCVESSVLCYNDGMPNEDGIRDDFWTVVAVAGQPNPQSW
jgi:hypothetical protein